MFISSCQAGQNVQKWVCQPLVEQYILGIVMRAHRPFSSPT